MNNTAVFAYGPEIAATLNKCFELLTSFLIKILNIELIYQI
jgi:hypothetical protein